jgi:hypothetical protein
MPDPEVVLESRGCGRRSNGEPDGDVVSPAVVRVVHQQRDVVAGAVVTHRQHLVVEREIARLGRGDGHQAERDRDAVVEVGPDLRPLHRDRAPRQPSLGEHLAAERLEAPVAVRQVHPLEVLQDAARQMPRVDQPLDDVRAQRLALFGPLPGRVEARVPVVQGGEDHPAAQAARGVADLDPAERGRPDHRGLRRPGVGEREAMLGRQELSGPGHGAPSLAAE